MELAEPSEAGLAKEYGSAWLLKGADTHPLQPAVVMWKCSVARSCDFSKETRNLDTPALSIVFDVGN